MALRRAAGYLFGLIIIIYCVVGWFVGWLLSSSLSLSAFVSVVFVDVIAAAVTTAARASVLAEDLLFAYGSHPSLNRAAAAAVRGEMRLSLYCSCSSLRLCFSIRPFVRSSKRRKAIKVVQVQQKKMKSITSPQSLSLPFGQKRNLLQQGNKRNE